MTGATGIGAEGATGMGGTGASGMEALGGKGTGMGMPDWRLRRAEGAMAAWAAGGITTFGWREGWVWKIMPCSCLAPLGWGTPGWRAV